MCVNCLRSQVDITAGLQKQVNILWCKECNRYLQPPKHWVRAELESKELLTFCIKRLKGLQKARRRPQCLCLGALWRCGALLKIASCTPPWSKNTEA